MVCCVCTNVYSECLVVAAAATAVVAAVVIAISFHIRARFKNPCYVYNFAKIRSTYRTSSSVSGRDVHIYEVDLLQL